jgi:hypothetical protein
LKEGEEEEGFVFMLRMKVEGSITIVKGFDWLRFL